jgi:hypothetical protein
MAVTGQVCCRYKGTLDCMSRDLLLDNRSLRCPTSCIPAEGGCRKSQYRTFSREERELLRLSQKKGINRKQGDEARLSARRPIRLKSIIQS